MSSGSTRARIDDLTDTQRRVLDLIAAGKTNHEIGQALGITLDGAKYHVTEILNKLGVDSREEAAALLQPETAPSRWRRLAPRSTLRRVAFVGGAVAALGLAVVLFAALLAKGDDSEDVPHIQAAFLVGDDPKERSIVIVDGDGERTDVGEPGTYVLLEWSPDGRRLAALELDRERIDETGGMVLHVLTPGVGVEEPWDIGSHTSIFHSMAWSPDGEYLAALFNDGVSIFEPDGGEVATASLLGEESGSFIGDSVAWAPDSKRAAAANRATMVVLETSGASRSFATPPVGEAGLLTLLAWPDPQTARIATFEGTQLLPVGWEADVTGGDIQWVKTGSDVDPFAPVDEALDAAARAAEATAQSELVTLLALGNERFSFVFSEERTMQGQRLTAVVVKDGEDYIPLQVPDNAWFFSTYRAHVAVVVVDSR